MARPHYHRDLLGTAFAIAGTAFVLAAWTLRLSLELSVVAFGLATLVATWLARHIYRELSLGEATFASALVMVVVAGITTSLWSRLATSEVIAWSGIAVAGGCAGAFAAMKLPMREPLEPRTLFAGLVTMSAQLVPAIFVTLLDLEEATVIFTSALGGVFGGMVAVRVVPAATTGNIFVGNVVVMWGLVAAISVRAGAGSIFVGLAIFAPIWALATAFGAVVAKPRRPPSSSPPLPRAQAR